MKQTDTIDFYSVGLIAFPSNRGYPTRDKNTAENEADYLRGWNAAKRLQEIDREFE